MQMVVATPIAVALGAFAGLMFSTIRLGGVAGGWRVVARSAVALAIASLPLAVATMLTEQLWIGSCIPFGIALAYEREERPPLGGFVVGAQIAVILVGFPIVMAATAWALDVVS